MSAPLSVLAQFGLPSLGGEGPGDVEQLLTTFYVLLGLGFLVAVMGHLFQMRALVITGIVLIFIGTGVFMVAVGSYG